RRLRDRHAEMLGRKAERANSDDGAEQKVRPRSRSASPLQELQRKFVEGRLTLDEYEREIDALERLD
ncbi:MAG: hypothetical protein GWN99_11585, partial [Gemmatimonadetes bacterium]|nr:hypothetical protein [Gemmatimonadota bacterium]NIS01686.1 hypothetical protein [Gemmatimonadota bacterium]NIT67440.1 hypothetical protein [Gemmatimonadota bacterium]NIV24148.1 hypothetical protein [Gemmatimonadota bacterium]NIW37466.1 hypothetical protein [Gemmatimonadota bacterium]